MTTTADFAAFERHLAQERARQRDQAARAAILQALPRTCTWAALQAVLGWFQPRAPQPWTAPWSRPPATLRALWDVLQDYSMKQI